MYRMIGILALALLVVAFGCSIVFAGSGMCGGGMGAVSAPAAVEQTEGGEVMNDTCPVFSGKVDEDTPYRAEYIGKTVGFCCGGCVEEFKKDPAKYMKVLEEQNKE